jgi:DNA-binding transcriptional MerR regulator
MMESKNKVATWLTLEEVQDYLGVRAQTIYAYVSRGLIASHPDPQNIRRSLYSAENIQKLKQKKQQGRKRETLAANTLLAPSPVFQQLSQRLPAVGCTTGEKMRSTLPKRPRWKRPPACYGMRKP